MPSSFISITYSTKLVKVVSPIPIPSTLYTWVTNVERSRQAQTRGNLITILSGQVRLGIGVGQNVPSLGFCKFTQYFRSIEWRNVVSMRS